VAVIVISDASPIRALHCLGLLSLCRDLYGSVIVPEAVRQELLQPTSTCPALNIRDYSDFDVRKPRSKSVDLGVPSDLDVGETEAITLAIELHADLLLMDERKGTAAARHLGLMTIGVIGVLLEAKRRGLIGHVLPFVDRLVAELRFFVSPRLREQLARLADE
jgi:predicted nucleic acid-binding protein